MSKGQVAPLARSKWNLSETKYKVWIAIVGGLIALASFVAKDVYIDDVQRKIEAQSTALDQFRLLNQESKNRITSLRESLPNNSDSARKILSDGVRFSADRINQFANLCEAFPEWDKEAIDFNIALVAEMNKMQDDYLQQGTALFSAGDPRAFKASAKEMNKLLSTHNEELNEMSNEIDERADQVIASEQLKVKRMRYVSWSFIILAILVAVLGQVIDTKSDKAGKNGSV